MCRDHLRARASPASVLVQRDDDEVTSVRRWPVGPKTDAVVCNLAEPLVAIGVRTHTGPSAQPRTNLRRTAARQR
jgi:hypothetical protein